MVSKLARYSLIYATNQKGGQMELINYTPLTLTFLTAYSLSKMLMITSVSNLLNQLGVV
jgi:hypothetical protein